VQQWLNHYSRRLINYDSIRAYAVLGVVGGAAAFVCISTFTARYSGTPVVLRFTLAGMLATS